MSPGLNRLIYEEAVWKYPGEDRFLNFEMSSVLLNLVLFLKPSPKALSAHVDKQFFPSLRKLNRMIDIENTLLQPSLHTDEYSHIPMMEHTMICMYVHTARIWNIPNWAHIDTQAVMGLEYMEHGGDIWSYTSYCGWWTSSRGVCNIEISHRSVPQRNE